MGHMRKMSRQVPATLLTAIAAHLVANGCGASDSEVEIQRCVDGSGMVLPDYYCDSPFIPTHYYYMGQRVTGPPAFVYGGTGNETPGGRAAGYHLIPHDGARVVTPSGSTLGTVSGGTIQRGGFGGTSFGSGGSFGG